jgi:hypothetical protein
MPEKKKRKRLTPEEIEEACTFVPYGTPDTTESLNPPLSPMRDRKMWTYSENKLLDQITSEIMHAWKNDLIMMRQYYSEQAKISREINSIIKSSQLFLFELKGDIFEFQKLLRAKKPWYKRIWQKKK